MKSLTIFDIDDTLFRVSEKVHVLVGGKRVKSLTPAQLNVYKLQPGERLDFSDFTSSRHFQTSAKPIPTVFNTAKKLMKKLNKGDNRFIIVTARADMDDKNLFLSTFRKYGFDIDHTHIYRAGNITGNVSESKKKIIRTQLTKNTYDIARMFEDSKMNLNKFLELKKEFPHTIFEAFLVHEDGRITRYGR